VCIVLQVKHRICETSEIKKERDNKMSMGTIKNRVFFRSTYFRMVVIGICSVTLRAYVPQLPMYGAGHDDELMVSLANNLINGNWLGNYSDLANRTLAKPPGYAFFLVISYLFKVPSTVLVHLFITFLGLYIFNNLIKNGLNRVVAEIGYFVMVFSPVWFTASSSRIYRDYFLAGLMIAVIASSMNLFNQLGRNQIKGKISRRGVLNLGMASVAVGLALSWIRVTKNLTFSAIALVVFVLISSGFVFMRRPLKQFYVLLLVAGSILISFNVLPKAVAIQNERTYGVSLTNNYTEGSFARAMKVMASVRETKPRQYVVVSKSMRLKMYSVSPTLRKIEPYLELPLASGWKIPPCQSQLRICDESAAWFPWEIRDGVFLAGLGSTALEFEKTFEKISLEIEAACKSRFIQCGEQGLASGIGPLNDLSKRHIAESFAAAAKEVLDLSGGEGVGASFVPDVSDETVLLWNETVRYLPKNTPLNSVFPGVNAGSDSISLLSNVYKKFWPYFLILGIGGYLLFDSKKHNLRVMIFGIGCLVAAVAQLSQLAVAEASIGMFVRGATGYFLPIYPFVIVSCTIGLDILVCRLKNIQPSQSGNTETK
jgi:hypothetical protein